jgi:hypothetical protein
VGKGGKNATSVAAGFLMYLHDIAKSQSRRLEAEQEI